MNMATDRRKPIQIPVDHLPGNESYPGDRDGRTLTGPLEGVVGNSRFVWTVGEREPAGFACRADLVCYFSWEVIRI